ncbi:TonB-dependent receptor [Seonamhaeicola sp.]|uniref:SusC/RagA family TonB-linked outer membrane protein n=1 Tax=Seonamhaeicola sp. TaxID=1912245 RepID=UPI002626440F|nr:TonB-dependent receptor [Seonamhaeicola sp.]
MKNVFSKMAFVALLLFVTSAFSQSVSGNVTSDTGPLPGVNIIVKGSTVGATTDFDGNFTIKASANDVLVFSYLGYKTQEVNINGQTRLSVFMEEDTGVLDEIVIVGYGQTQNKRSVTTSISTVSTKQLEELPVQRAEAALQGTVPGVVVVQTSGSPGAPLTIRMRGIGSPNASNPLYIVDGLPVTDLQYLNSADIQSYSLLKDAAATAIYGARGGNGVVLVQTKRGKDTDGKLKVSVSGFYGTQSLGNKPDIMNASQYAQYYNEGVALAGGNPPNGLRGAFSDSELASLPDTDWYDAIFDDAPIRNTSVSIIGGNDRVKYALAGGIFDQDGIVGGNQDKANFRRENYRGNVDMNITENFKLSTSFDFSDYGSRFVSLNNGGTGVALMNYINALPSIYPIYAENGEIFNMGRQNPAPVYNGVTLNTIGAVTNPIWSLDIQNNRAQSNVKLISAAANWEPVSGLSLNASFSDYRVRTTNESFTPFLEHPEQTFTTLGNVNYSGNITTFNRDQVTLTAQYDLGQHIDDNHSLRVLGGYEVLEDRLEIGDNIRVNAPDIDPTGFGDLSIGSLSESDLDALNAIVNPGAIAETALISYFGKLDYNFKEKYLASFTIRNDRSSNFGPNNRSGWFPAASAGWVISEESFLENTDAINLLKLRASWGISGQDASPRNLAFKSTVNSNISTGYGGTPGVVLTGLANPDLKWEEITSANIGLDLNAFNNSFGLTVDYYIKKTSDILLQANTPLATGLNPSVVNVGDVENRGFEIMTSYRKNNPDGFSWNAAFNIGFNTNEVTNLGANGQALEGGFTGQLFADPITLTAVGHPVSSFYGYEVEGIDAAGNLLFKDLDGVGLDKTQPTIGDKTFIGNPLPDFTYGINLGASYKGFDFSAFFYGSQGNDIFDATIRYDAIGSNRPVRYLQDNAPKNIVLGGTNGEQLVSDFHVQDGSFLKLKNIALGYTLPESISKKIRAEKIRVYVSGQNLLVITGYEGVDPEIGQSSANNMLDMGIDRGFYPQAEQILFGFQLGF